MVNLKYTLVWILPLISAFTWLVEPSSTDKRRPLIAAPQSALCIDGSEPKDSVRDPNSTSVKAVALIPRPDTSPVIIFLPPLLESAGYVISAIFICAEYQRLGVHFRQHRILRVSFWMKLFFILIEFCLAVVFVGTSFTDGHKNIAAVFEWIIALIFTFYVLTFFVDLLPASRSHQARTNMELGHADEATREHGNTNGYAMNGYDGAAEQPKPPMAQNY
ncbi:MAG: hypothetical protein LQ350_003510 [Teloschistes chrysophthalmus]|nr:MAG: hypothetical protein LQ350_003510 [Niorma chrysophthalma]